MNIFSQIARQLMRNPGGQQPQGQAQRPSQPLSNTNLFASFRQMPQRQPRQNLGMGLLGRNFLGRRK